MDHAVGPVLVVLIEFRFVRAFGNAVEIGKEIGREVARVVLAFFGLLQEVVDACLRVNLFLDVEWWSVGDEVAPILFDLSAPHKLGIETGIAPVTNRLRLLMLLLHDRLLSGGVDVLPLYIVVLDRLDGFVGGRLFLGRHGEVEA